jgi:hypothetical protein
MNRSQTSSPTCSNVHAPALRRRRHRRGFTIIEAALATVIIGTGVLAILAAQQAYHRKNMWSQRMATGVQLANELRELTLPLPMHDPLSGNSNLGPESDEYTAGVPDPKLFDDLDDFAGTVTSGKGSGVTISPPINGLRQDIAGLEGWSQKVTVANVLPENIGVSDALTQPLGSTNTVRISVTVTWQPSVTDVEVPMTTLTWVAGL